MKQDQDIHRSHRFSLHYQLESLTKSLVAISTSNAEITDLTRNVVRKVRKDLLELINGSAVDAIPEVGDGSTAADLLMIVSILSGTSQSFLTEQEVETIASRAASFLGGVIKAKEAVGI